MMKRVDENQWSEKAARLAALGQQANALIAKRHEIEDWRERVEHVRAEIRGL
jgi:hypothetical protein